MSGAAATGSALQIDLHPLVIINVSDHYTRAKVQNDDKNPRVIGAMLGVQSGRHVEIFSSFELVYTLESGKIEIDKQYFKDKSEQFKKVFSKYDFLGWYSTGDKVLGSDVEIHKQITEFNESPLYLLLDPIAATKSKDLPITIYESELHIVDDIPKIAFVGVAYKIETGEAERIAVDHIAHVTAATTAGSMLTTHLQGMGNAIKMLTLRITVLMNYLEGTKKGQVTVDHSLLRHIGALCDQLPAIDTQQFKGDFISEYNDALLVTYLASITKGASQVNDLVDKFNLISDRHSRRRFF